MFPDQIEEIHAKQAFLPLAKELANHVTGHDPAADSGIANRVFRIFPSRCSQQRHVLSVRAARANQRSSSCGESS